MTYSTPTPSKQEIVSTLTELKSQGRYAEALAIVDQALGNAPIDAGMLVERASILYEWGRIIEAKVTLLRAHTLGVSSSSVFLSLGWCFMATGMPLEAIQWMTSAVHEHPDSNEACFGLATALSALGQAQEAQRTLQRVLRREPEHYGCLLQLGELTLASNALREAETLFRDAIKVQPQNPAGWVTLGVVLDRQGRWDEAVEAYEAAQRLEKETGIDIENFVNLAVVRCDHGRFQDARRILETNLPRKPGILAHLAYAFLLLREGHLREGWEHYEFRLMLPNRAGDRLPFVRPPWLGQRLHGCTILLRREQGIGDAIQFARYACKLKELGATVWLQVRDSMLDLAIGFDGVDRVFGEGEQLPDFHYYVYLGSLPRLFGTELETIPSRVPYLSLSEERVAAWEQRLRDGVKFKIGLVWAGQPSHLRDWERSIPLECLSAVSMVNGVRLFSLQKGTAAKDIGRVPELAIEDLSGELDDFSDTAAAIAQLDLVISVDTAVAHLAGALGKQVWLILPLSCDFRWLADREDSPWYPTMRLFRQRKRGDWSEVISRVSMALGEALRDRPDDHSRRISVDLNRDVDSMPPLLTPSPRADSHGATAIAETPFGIVHYMPAEVPLGRSIRWYGEYMQQELAVLVKLIRPGATVIEVGANVGLHALALAAAVGDRGHIMLFESRPLHHRLLTHNIRANGARNVTIMRRVGSSPRCVTEESIDALRLDRLDAIKVSGAASALEVLGGARDSLWRLRPILIVSAVNEAKLATLAHSVKDFGFRCWTMDRRLYNKDNFNRHDEDVFSGEMNTILLGIAEELDVNVEILGFGER